MKRTLIFFALIAIAALLYDKLQNQKVSRKRMEAQLESNLRSTLDQITWEANKDSLSDVFLQTPLRERDEFIRNLQISIQPKLVEAQLESNLRSTLDQITWEANKDSLSDVFLQTPLSERDEFIRNLQISIQPKLDSLQNIRQKQWEKSRKNQLQIDIRRLSQLMDTVQRGESVWFYHLRTPKLGAGSGICLYIVEDGNEISNLFLRIQYLGARPLEIEGVGFMIDGRLIIYLPGVFSFYSSLYKWSDKEIVKSGKAIQYSEKGMYESVRIVQVDNPNHEITLQELINEIISSDQCYMTFLGNEMTQEILVTDSTKETMHEVLTLYLLTREERG